MISMKRSILLLGGAFALIFAWLVLRRPAPPTPSAALPPPVAAPGAVPTEASVEAARAAFHATAVSPRTPSEPVEVPPPNLETLRPEREALYQELLAETNALLSEVQTALAPLRTTDAATLATAWSLANNWGIFFRGESTVDQRVTNAVLRQELASLHRRVLVEIPQRELRAFIGEEIPAEVLTQLETLGRAHLETAQVRKTAAEASNADRSAARKRAAAGEQPGEAP